MDSNIAKLKKVTTVRKVLLINTCLDEHRGRNPPLGLAYIASYLIKKGYDVKIFDPLPGEEERARDFILKYKPDIVGISCMTPSVNKAYYLAKIIKLTNSNIPLVFGGIHPSSVPEEVIKNNYIDYVVYGEGENTLLELIEAIKGEQNLKNVKGIYYKKGNKIIKNPPRELIEKLDAYPPPAWNLFSDYYLQRGICIRGLWLKVAPIMGSRGCPYGCTYCASKVMFGQRVRFHSYSRIVDEIEYMIKKYHIEAFYFLDDTFTINKQLVKDVCNEILRRKIKIRWAAQVRADCIDEELLSYMIKAGCIQVGMGVESGSDKILKTLNKGITVEQIKRAFKLIKKFKLRTVATFMIGNPRENIGDIKETRKLAKIINADFTQFFITTPYPGTPMYNDLDKKGFLKNKGDYSYYRHGGTKLRSLITTTLPEEKLTHIQDRLNEEFLRGGLKGFLFNLRFWQDTLRLIYQNPWLIKESLKKMIKTKRIIEAYRTIYYAHDMRR